MKYIEKDIPILVFSYNKGNRSLFEFVDDFQPFVTTKKIHNPEFEFYDWDDMSNRFMDSFGKFFKNSNFSFDFKQTALVLAPKLEINDGWFWAAVVSKEHVRETAPT